MNIASTLTLDTVNRWLQERGLIAVAPSHTVIRELGGYDEWLARWGKIAFYWSYEDVLNIRPDLTEEQAFAVLKHAKEWHDSETGMNWDVLIAAAESLFGPEIEQPANGGQP